MPGISHHYLPAAFLGRFSADTSGSLRERLLYSLKMGEDQAAATTAERIGCEDNLYRLFGVFNNQQPDAVDEVWSLYEQKLSPALDELSRSGQATISANTWLRVLVPFVTGLFVRGKEFGNRYEERSPALKEIYKATPFSDPKFQSDNTNNARLMEFQRLLAPIMAARWVVMHTQGNTPLITNGLGFTIFQPSVGAEAGIAIPIGPKAILGILRTWPNDSRVILQDSNTGQWRTPIEHHQLKAESQVGFNDCMANISRDFLAGPTAEVLERHSAVLKDTSRIKAGHVEAFWPSPLVRVAHELEWYRAVSTIKKKSSMLNQADLQTIDWAVVARDWSPATILAHNLKDFPTGMLLKADKITIGMTEVPGFTDGTQNSPYIITSKPK